MLNRLGSIVLSILFDKILIGKMSLLASNFALVFFCAIFLDEMFANSVFQVLAFSTLINSLISFGSNATLVKKIVGNSKSYSFSLFNSLILLKILLLSLIFLLIKLFDNPISADLTNAVIISSACLMLMVYDYLAEALGESHLEMLSVVKIFVSPITLAIKIYFLLNYEHVGILLLQLDWLVISLVFVSLLFFKYRAKVFLVSSNAFFKELPTLVFNNIYIWLSGVLQIGWSRGLFLVFTSTLNTSAANNYFVLIRVVESLVFMPNAISARYFPKLVQNIKNVVVLDNLKVQYLRSHIQVSVFSSFLVCVVMSCYFIWVEMAFVEALVVIFMLFFISLLHFFRSSLSRELVLTGHLSWSFHSYVIACVSGVLSLLLLGPQSLLGATLVYGIFVAAAYIIPLIIGRSLFKSYIKSFAIAINFGK